MADIQIRDRRPLPRLPSYRSSDASPVAREAGDDHGAARESPRLLQQPLKSPFIVTTDRELCSVPDWPMEPQTLRRGPVTMTVSIVSDFVLTMVPVLFIVLGILSARLDGQHVSDNATGKLVEQMSKLGPTIFPIMFAAVASRSLKAIARFYAEQGMKLGVLELLLASGTVWGTFESQVLLRRFTTVGAHLFILWSLSPLGGQASLRLLSTDTLSTNSSSIVKYLPTFGMDYGQTNSGVLENGDSATALAVTNSLYNANLLAPNSIKLSNQDTWGNMKIPRIETVQNVTQSTDGWTNVPSLSSLDNFTTLVGLPIAGTLTTNSTFKEFNLDYAYMNLQCDPEWCVSAEDGPWTDALGMVWSSTNGSKAFYDNTTGEQTSFFLDTNMPFDSDRVTFAYEDQNATTSQDPVLQARRNILFGSQYWGSAVDTSRGYAVFYRNCTIWSEYIEAKVQCHAQTCDTVAIRPSVVFAKRNTNLTPFDLLQIASHLFEDLPLATGSLRVTDAAPTELFIRGADTPFLTNSSSISDMTTITSDVFANRLSLLLNTYYQLSVSPMSFVGNLPDPRDAIWDSQITSAYPATVDSARTPFLARNATAVVTTIETVYACNFLWLALLLVSSSVLFLTGVAGIVLKYQCLGPDMMGFVASLTYNNPYVRLPRGGGTLDAMDRARLLKDIRVKIGDANVEDEIGHIVFGTLDSPTSIGKLRQGKEYI